MNDAVLSADVRRLARLQIESIVISARTRSLSTREAIEQLNGIIDILVDDAFERGVQAGCEAAG